jgi:uncharacterized repeat protein (TIGR03847 family)
MSRNEINLNPVSVLTVDAVGQPGKRTFYLQGRKDEQVVSLLVEKVQIQTLAVGVEQFIGELASRFPDLSPASGDYDETQMHIEPPVDPLFRVAELGLAYEPDTDLAILIVREMTAEGESEEDASVVRFWCTRSQLRALGRWGLELAGRGRPICPYCGEPMDPEGHLCPKKNGHRH